MIEKTILNHLSNNLDCGVYMEKPRNPAERSYVVIELTGQREEEHIMHSTFAFQTYGESLLKAAELRDEVKAAVKTLIELDEVARVDLNSSYNFTDPSTKEYRYQTVFDITHY
jgi:hypothetical protein